METREQRRERLARVLCKLAGYKPDQLEPGDCPTGVDAEALAVPDGRNAGGDFCHFLWRQFVKRADAIIASDLAAGVVCVPGEATEHAICLGDEAIIRHLDNLVKADGTPAESCWRAMIDAAQGKPVGSE